MVVRRALLGFISLLLIGCTSAPPPPVWVPRVGERYPDAEFIDHNGRIIRLSSFAGKVLLIEPAAIPCAGCQAFAGGNRYGGFGGMVPQAGLKSIEEYVPEFANGVRLSSPDITFIQILFFNQRMRSPTQEEVAAWRKHFRMDSHRNWHVLGAPAALVNDTTRRMIPGFQLIDRDFILRFDAAGHTPRHDLYRELLPAIPRILSLAQQRPSER